ncbi:O-antigen ligase family protein [Candidatus Pelagibacter sp.]|nr:O-antigen ligase family protein [Candidatus Pelagibacter sp.]
MSLAIILMPILILSGPLFPDIIVTLTSIFYLKRFGKNFIELIKIYWLIIIFWLICLISSMLSEDIFYSLKSSVFYLRFFIYSSFIYFLLKERILNLSLLFFILFLVYIFLIFDSHFQYIFGNNIFGIETYSKLRISSIFGSELIMGSFLLKSFPLFIVLAIYKKKYNFIFLLPLIYSSIILSGERSTIILSLLLLIIFFKLKMNFMSKLINLLFILMVFLTQFFFNNEFNYNFTERVKEEVVLNIDKDIKKKKSDYNKVLPFNIFSENHTRIYNTSYLMFLDNKFIGHGPKSFRNKCQKYDEKSCTTHPHNHIFQMLSEVGLLGFFVYFSILLMILKSLVFNFFSKKELSEINFILCLSIIINFFPFLPAGNFFNNYVNIMMYLPVGFYLYFKEKI